MLPRFAGPSGIALAVALAACAAPERREIATPGARDGAGGPRVLAVLARPDDEVAFAGTLFKVTTFLGGACDAVVLTGGESSFEHAALAEPLYRRELGPGASREDRVEVRRAEMFASAEVLALRTLYFLEARDPGGTTDLDAVLGAGADEWDLAGLRAKLRAIVVEGEYDFVIAPAPAADSRAEHKAAALLATEAALALPEDRRPVVLVGQARGRDNASALAFAPEESGVPVGPFVFDRTQRFGPRDGLDYRIVVNWTIAAHKSQGALQLAVQRDEREEYFLFGVRDLASARKAADLFERLRGRQFERDGDARATTASASR
jgi:LmbE family N-acetylglucosaminyl deacetylase